MSEKKKSVKRQAIGLATCHRILGENSKADRVSEAAAEEARKRVKELLVESGKKCAQELELTKKKTVTEECVHRAMIGKCNGLSAKSLAAHGHKESHRGLAEAGVVRLVQKGLRKGDRVSDDAKKALVRGGEAYLAVLAQRAGEMALHAKRKTILASDVQAAARMLMD